MGTSPQITFPRGINITTSSGAKRRLAGLNRNQGPRVVRWLNDTWNAQGNSLRIQDITHALKTGQISPFMLSQWKNEYINFVGNMSDTWRISSATSGDFVMGGMFKSAVTRSKLEFDLASNAMSHYFQNRSALTISNFSLEQQKATRFLLNYFTTEQPLTVSEMGRVLRSSVGLSNRDSKTIVNLGKSLQAQGLSKKKIAARLFKREAELTAVRAKLIAKTEISNAYNRATREAYRQALESATLDPEFANMIPVKIWDASPSCCVKFCCPLHGEAVPMDDTFSDGSEAPPQHPRCDCTENTGLMTPEELGITQSEAA